MGTNKVDGEMKKNSDDEGLGSCPRLLTFTVLSCHTLCFTVMFIGHSSPPEQLIQANDYLLRD